nr:putative ribonuclease H-like domain-containing protein [Tanacetum cinerariifolium]
MESRSTLGSDAKCRVTRENNMYNVDLKNFVPSGDLTCLFEKAILDESNLWHRRLGHINFKSMNKLVKGNLVRGNQPNDNACIKENLDAGKVRTETVSYQQYVLLPLWSIGSQDPHNTDADVANAAFDVQENKNDVHVFASRSDKNDNKKHDEKAKRDDKGKSHVDSPTGVRDLRAEFKEFSSNSTNRVNVVSAPVNAIGPNPTNIANNFNTASPSVNAVSPNFGIVRKSSFVDPSKYPDDPDMSELEDIVYLDDEEDVGVEADLSNLEINIPVSPILTTRVHKDHHVTQIIGDLTLAPQIRSMIRMVKEQGGLHQINDEDFHTRMFTCFLSQEEPKKGHTQEEGIDYDEVFAPIARIEAIWLFLAYASFMGFMVYQMDVKSGFLYGTIKKEVYVCQPTGFEDPDYLDKVYKVVEALYGLHQAPRACYETLANYLLENASTSIETEKPLLKDPNGEDVDVHTYRSMIGSLMYLTSSRPDIMFVVCACVRFQVTPKVSHLHAVKIILVERSYAFCDLEYRSLNHYPLCRLAILCYHPHAHDLESLLTISPSTYALQLDRFDNNVSFEEEVVHQILLKTLTHILELSSCIYLDDRA